MVGAGAPVACRACADSSPVRLAAPADAVRAAAIDRARRRPRSTTARCACRSPTTRSSRRRRRPRPRPPTATAAPSSTATGTVGIDIPFFGGRSGRSSRSRSAATAALRDRRSCAPTLEGAPAPRAAEAGHRAPDRRRSRPSSRRILATAAAAAVAVVSFAAALFGQLGGPISRHVRRVRHDARATRSPITRLGALIALVGIALADRGAGGGRSSSASSAPPVVCALSALAPNLAFFTAAQVLQRGVPDHDRDRRGRRGHRGGTRRRPRVRDVDARARGRLRLLVLGRSRCRSPTSATSGWRIPFVARRAHDLPRAGASRGASRRRRRYDGARGPHRRATAAACATFATRATAAASCCSPRSRFLANVFSAPSSQLTNKYLDRRARLLEQRHRAVPHRHDRHPRARSASCSAAGSPRRAAAGRSPRSRSPIATATQMVFFLTGGALLWVMSATSIIAAERGRHRARHARRRALPHRDAQHVERAARRDRRARLGARLRARRRALRIDERQLGRAIALVRHRLARRGDRRRAAAPRVARAARSTT